MLRQWHPEEVRCHGVREKRADLPAADVLPVRTARTLRQPCPAHRTVCPVENYPPHTHTLACRRSPPIKNRARDAKIRSLPHTQQNIPPRAPCSLHVATQPGDTRRPGRQVHTALPRVLKCLRFAEHRITISSLDKSMCVRLPQSLRSVGREV